MNSHKLHTQVKKQKMTNTPEALPVPLSRPFPEPKVNTILTSNSID